MKLVAGVFIMVLISACSFNGGPFDIDTGLDGCVTIHIDELTVPGGNAKHVRYHRVNEKCQDVNPHMVPPTEPVS